MKTFSESEMKLIRKLQTLPADATLKIQVACPLHSVCTPLPLFRVYKIDDASFEAQWNDYHRAGPRQVFKFAEAA